VESPLGITHLKIFTLIFHFPYNNRICYIDETKYKTDAEKNGCSYIDIRKNNTWELTKNVDWRCDVNGEEQKDQKNPVIHVSWNDANEYCKWLSKKTNMNCRLPTEAEWEYACRSDTSNTSDTKPFNTGENLTTEQANYNGNVPYKNNPKGVYLKKTMPVGSYKANKSGLYDMHGNVWEWCSDWYSKNYYDECKSKGTVTNPERPKDGSDRVSRGGSWGFNAGGCRSAIRGCNPLKYHSDFTGFRLVISFVP